jgi:CheY-like chemotaxis protein
LLASGVRSGGSRGGNYYVPDSHKNPIVLHIGAAATTKIDGSLLPFELRSHTQSFSLAAISPLEAACWTNRKNPMSLRILVVDDDPASLGSLCRLLKLRGYTVHELTDPTAALDEAVEFQPHVVILDYLMPRMHGGDVAWQLASNPLLRDVRVIVSSAYSAEEIRRNLPPTKIPILPKPIDFDALLQLIWDEGSYRTADS